MPVTFPPPAEGTRVAWHDVPEPVRNAIERICGGAVSEALTQPGGFSPGVAARVRCANGTRCFVKAVSAEANPDSPVIHRAEAAVLAGLRPLITDGRLPAPRLWGTVDLPPWFALVTDLVDGYQPAVPWQDSELKRVLAAVDQLADTLTPAPVGVATFAEKHAANFSGWRTLAAQPPGDELDPWSRTHLSDLAALEATWVRYAAGSTLLHCDIRADNLLLTDSRVVFVDWPGACRGAAFLDLVWFAPSVTMQGGPEPGKLLARTRTGSAVSREALTAVVCALAGFFTEHALRPPPPGIPGVRAFQAAQGEVARRWLAELL